MNNNKQKKQSLEEKSKKFFRENDIDIDNQKDIFDYNEQETWIVSDNNSTFKSFISYG
jgi:hypothetical protein